MNTFYILKFLFKITENSPVYVSMLVLCKLYNDEDIENAFTYYYCYIDDNQLLYKVKDKNILEGGFSLHL